MSHKHWPEDHPYYEHAPVCRFRTKRECDQAYAAWKREQKAEYEAKQVAKHAAEVERREQVYQAYVRGATAADIKLIEAGRSSAQE